MSNIGLYIHIPFCNGKCPYCDFFSKTSEKEQYDIYIENLISNIEAWGKKTHFCVDTVYFGGGTPSVLGTKRIIKIFNSIKSSFKLIKPEVTIEINPDSSKIINFNELFSAGFNRLSIGLQSANENELKILGRKHSAALAKATVLDAQNAGFKNISLDLMIGIPLQTKQSLANSIKFCSMLNVTHISSYILKVEKGTIFDINRHSYSFLSDDEQADLYLFSCKELNKYGYIQYEISNYSKKGYESKHNLKYWNCEEYLGIGPSAHSMIDKERFYYNSSFDEFNKNIIIKDGPGQTEEEFIMLKLRLANGLNNNDYKKTFDKNIPEEVFINAEKYVSTGHLIIENNTIKLTPKGFLISNYIISELIL